MRGDGDGAFGIERSSRSPCVPMQSSVVDDAFSMAADDAARSFAGAQFMAISQLEPPPHRSWAQSSPRRLVPRIPQGSAFAFFRSFGTEDARFRMDLLRVGMGDGDADADALMWFSRQASKLTRELLRRMMGAELTAIVGVAGCASASGCWLRVGSETRDAFAPIEALQ